MAVNPLSIIIPTKNEAKHIAACVDAFMPFLGKGVREILVIDNFSTDHTVALATARGARVLSQGPERSTQRNAGWKTASGEYVFFVDVDGHREDPGVKSALEELGQRAAYLKVLGSYPVAVY